MAKPRNAARPFIFVRLYTPKTTADKYQTPTNMPRAPKILALLLLLSQTATLAVAQKHPLLGTFSVSEYEGAVYLRWSIVAGSTCNGIGIHRSTDSATYTEVGRIDGVCGSADVEKPYEFTDNNPVKNKVNSYRLALGGQGFSETVSVEIFGIGSTGYQIRPNPASGKATIYFANNTRLRHRLSLYALAGALVFATTTQEDFFDLDTGAFPSGMYFFEISAAGNAPSIAGKIMVR